MSTDKLDPDEKIEVAVPPDDFRIDHPNARTVYLAAQSVLAGAICLVGRDLAFSVVLSGFTRELRRHMTPEQASELLHKMADTMHKAARGDR